MKPLDARGAPRPPVAVRGAGDLLFEARDCDRAGRVVDAIAAYEATIARAEAEGARTVLSEALRRLAILRHRREEFAVARELCRRSLATAREIGNELLAAEAINTLGVQDLTTGALEGAREHFLQALAGAGHSRELSARVEQNLGIIANIHGDLDEAGERYERSLEAYRASGDQHGCGIAYCNMGMVSEDQGLFDQAGEYFQKSYDIAQRSGDRHLQGLCLVNQADVHVARQRYDEALRNAEEALVLFDQLGDSAAKSDAYRVIGVVYRETGRAPLAESRLRAAIDLAVACGSTLNEAEASRELALLYRDMGRNQDALTLLNVALGLFRRMDARADLINVDSKVADLEQTYLAVVREWGQSIESADSYTFGHCGRVGENAVAVAEQLGLDKVAQTTIRLGAYLHDLGKVKVPHEILNKSGPLTRDEFEVVQLHPVWGVELLQAIEFPWDLKPIIRSHHEKYDGSGYPDRLRGDEVPLAAQIVGIVDMYDALTTTRAYRAALAHGEAMMEIERCRSWWSERVFEAFRAAMQREPALATAVPSRD